MNKIIGAIIWREYQSFKHRLQQVLVNTFSIFVFITIVGVVRLLSIKTKGTVEPFMIDNVIIYISLTGAYMSLLAVLRFWQEKSHKTIESLLSLPIGLRWIMISKCIVPIVVSIVVSFLDSLMASAIISILLGKLYISYKVFIIPMIFALIIGIPYSVINGYTMWCMSITYSKMMQGITSLGYIALIGVLWTNVYMSVAYLLQVIFGCAVALTILAIICLAKMEKEKVALNLLD